MSLSPLFTFRRGVSPIIAAAIHDGHDTRRGVERHLLLNETQRLREEDPYTGEWTQIAKTQILGTRSRFEVDLNRPREKAVYQSPSDAWGLELWDEPLSQAAVQASLEEYDAFYRAVQELLEGMIAEHGHVVVYDLHTYNFRRDHIEANAEENPEVNLGTGTMDRTYWAPVVDRFLTDLRGYDFHGRTLDVRENVKFKGGQFGKWIHQTFPETACCLSIEFKKFFMDEWSGAGDLSEVDAVYSALSATLPGVTEALQGMNVLSKVGRFG